MKTIQRILSCLAGSLARCRVVFIKNMMISLFIQIYKVNMEEAMRKNPSQYIHFNDFFTRKLKPESRSIDLSKDILVSPVDGFLSEKGVIEEGNLIQAKGKLYTLSSLLANQPSLKDKFLDGSFFTVYLSPANYHRIHMPYRGVLKSVTYVPGTLFPVNERSVKKEENLFARNERIIALFQTSAGNMAVILIGALLVGSIEITAQEIDLSSHYDKIQNWNNSVDEVVIEKGEELGLFKMGSTVILLLEKDKVKWSNSLSDRTPLKMGEMIGELNVEQEVR